MPVKIKEYLDQATILDLFIYKNGNLYWKHWKKVRQMDGPAGSLRKDGYRVINYKSQKYCAHRLVWIYHNGNISTEIEVDHIDGSGHPKNNAIENLRLGTHGQNAKNRHGFQSASKTGVRGVGWHVKFGMFRVRIAINGISTLLGYFYCPWRGAHVWNAAAKIHHGEFMGQPSVVPEGFRHPKTGELMQPPAWFINGTEPPPIKRGKPGPKPGEPKQ